MGYFEFLTGQDLDLVHQTSMRLLADVGVAFPRQRC